MWKKIIIHQHYKIIRAISYNKKTCVYKPNWHNINKTNQHSQKIYEFSSSAYNDIQYSCMG